jgi:hypothetical protein
MSSRVNISIDQGASFNTQINLNYANGSSINLASYSAKAQIRKTYTSANTYSFTTAVYANGLLTLALSSNTSNSMSYGRYVYDVIVKDSGGYTSRVIEGQVTINPSVSR